MITFMEVTEQKRAQAVLLEHESLRRMAAVMRDADDAITVQALDGRILAWNRTAEKRYGYSEAEALTMNIQSLFPEGQRKAALAVIARLVKAEVLEPYHTQRLTKHEKIVPISLTAHRALERVRASLRRVHDPNGKRGEPKMVDELVEPEISEESGTFPAVEEETARRLRQRALDEARARHTPIPEDLSGLSVEAARSLLHDLRVHRIELELQNEELRSSQEQLEVARARYFDLYDLAPVGYVTISESGIVLEANLTAAGLLDKARSAIVKQPWSRFVFPADQDIYFRHRRQLFASGAPHGCELRLLKANGESFWVRLEARVAEGDDRARVCRTVLSDISERKRAEETLRTSEARHRTLFQIRPTPF